MAVGILVALKTFEDVEAVHVAVLGRQLGRMARPHAGAAQEQQHLVFAGLGSQLREEVGIRYAARIGGPLHRTVLGIGDVDPADPVALGIRAHIDELDSGIALQQVIRFLRRDGAGIRRTFIGPAAGGGQDVGGGSHGVLDESGVVWSIIVRRPRPANGKSRCAVDAPQEGIF